MEISKRRQQAKFPSHFVNLENSSSMGTLTPSPEEEIDLL